MQNFYLDPEDSAYLGASVSESQEHWRSVEYENDGGYWTVVRRMLSRVADAAFSGDQAWQEYQDGGLRYFWSYTPTEVDCDGVFPPVVHYYVGELDAIDADMNIIDHNRVAFGHITVREI